MSAISELSKKTVSYFSDEDISIHCLCGPNPMRPLRVKLTNKLVEGYGLDRKMKMHRPRQLSYEELNNFHADGARRCAAADPGVCRLAAAVLFARPCACTHAQRGPSAFIYNQGSCLCCSDGLRPQCSICRFPTTLPDLHEPTCWRLRTPGCCAHVHFVNLSVLSTDVVFARRFRCRRTTLLSLTSPLHVSRAKVFG